MFNLQIYILTDLHYIYIILCKDVRFTDLHDIIIYQEKEYWKAIKSTMHSLRPMIPAGILTT